MLTTIFDAKSKHSITITDGTKSWYIEDYIPSLKKLKFIPENDSMNLTFRNGEEFQSQKQECLQALINLGCTIKSEMNENENESTVCVCVAQQPHPLTYNGKVTQALALARTIGQVDKLSGSRNISIDKGVNIFSLDSAIKLGVGVAKIFRYAVTEFTKRNAQNTPKERINPVVFLDLNDYAKANGVDTNSNDAMKNFRRKLKGDLEKLRTAGVTWSEKVQGKPRTYGGMNYIGKYEVKNNTIMIEFILTMAEYLVLLPEMPYPRSLYSLDDRDYNAFAIGEAMAIHYGQDNNIMTGTYNRLKVETLLKCTSYPSYDELQANRWDWQAHVKEPFEQCLDRLYQCGFLKDYKYEPDEKAQDILSYKEFISLLVVYELSGYEDPKKRKKIIEEKKAENMKKLQAGKKRKKSDNN